MTSAAVLPESSKPNALRRGLGWRLRAFTLSLLSAASCTAALPDIASVPKPVPEPASQSGWDTFTPPVDSLSPMLGAPTIAEWTRTGVSDDSLILTGDSFSNFTDEDEGKDTDFVVYGQTTSSDSATGQALIQRFDDLKQEGLKCAITLPSGLPPWSMYLLWVKNSTGYGRPVAINRTEAWWIGSDQSSRGEMVSVYGRNLSHSGGTTATWILLKPVGGAGEWVNATSVNPYRVQFTVPASLSNGTYEIWVHNGHGSSYGWSGPLSLTIIDAYRWDESADGIVNVKNHGAMGDGSTDDTAAILLAYSIAQQKRNSLGIHPTLYFPPGKYMLNRGIGLQHDIRILGAGRDVTSLCCTAEFTQPASDPEIRKGLLFAIRGQLYNIEVKDLTLDANGNFSATGPNEAFKDHGFLVWSDFLSSVNHDIKFTGVRIQQFINGSIGCALLYNIQRLTISDCEFLGGDLRILLGTSSVVNRCQFLFANDTFTGITSQKNDNLSITNCYFRDRDITKPDQQGLGRLIVGEGNLGTQNNLYIADNTTVDCAPRIGLGDRNDGEQILCEGNVTRYEGHAIAATSNTVTFDDLGEDPHGRTYVGLTAVVTRGKGFGQYRLIHSIDTDITTNTKAITVSPAWNVVPDSSSLVQIASTANRWVAYHNTLDGKDDYAERNTGSAGIEPFGGCYEWIGDGNTITNMRSGLFVIGLEQIDPIYSVQSTFFNYYANNIIRSCWMGMHVASGTQGNPEIGAGFFGNVFRNNRLSDIAAVGLGLAGMEMTVFEHNVFSEMSQAVDFDPFILDALTENVILYNNVFNLGTAQREGSFGSLFSARSIAPVLRDNTWTGFETTYAGILRSAVLEIPFRHLQVEGSSGGAPQADVLTIVNAFSVPLIWSATSDSSWLTLSPKNGSIADERSASFVTLTCNPAELQPGTYSGTITISAGPQLKKATVTFNVSGARPTTLIDPGFEAVLVGANNYYAFVYRPNTPGWSFSGFAGLSGNNSGFTSGNPNAPEKSQVAFIQQSGSMEQAVPFAAGTYVLSALAAQRGNWQAQAQSVMVYVDSEHVGTFFPEDVNYTLVSTRPFTVTGGTHTVRFVGQAVLDGTVFLDQLSLQATLPMVNSGFESPPVTSSGWAAFQYNPSSVPGVQPWTFAGNSGVTRDGSGFTVGNPSAPEGAQVAFIQTANSAVSRSITLPTNRSYTLSVAAAKRGNYNLAEQTVNVFFDQTLIGSITPHSTEYQIFSLPFTATSGIHELSFRGTVSVDSTALLDQLVIY